MTSDQYKELIGAALADKGMHVALMKTIYANCLKNAKMKFDFGEGKGRVSKRQEERMMKGLNYLRFEYNSRKIYTAYKIIVNRGVGMTVKNISFIEHKTRGGRLFRLLLSDGQDVGIFFTSHIFDRLLLRAKDEAENRYQAIKLILGEYLLNLISGDPHNALINIPNDEKQIMEVMIPNRYGCCFGESIDRVVFLKTFVGVDMLRPNQKKIYQGYLNSIDGIHDMKIDTDLYKELVSRFDDVSETKNSHTQTT